MARTLGSLTIDLLLKAGAFESDMGRAARIADKEAKAMARSFDAAGKAIGLALAAGVTTVAASVGIAINRMDDLSKAAQRANMPTEQFSALAHAADLADVSMQDLQGAMGKLAKAQGEALSGTSAQAKMFDALGISVKNTDGSLRNTSDVFSDFADKFQQFKGSPEIMAAGMQVFGRSFQNLIPLLKDGSGGLRDAAEEAKSLGLILSTEAGANAEHFNDNLSRLKTLAGGLGMSLAAELLPRMVKLTDNIVQMVKAAGGAEAIMRKLAGAFDTTLTVVKALGVYIGSTYAASFVLATARMVAMVSTTGALTAAKTALTAATTRYAVALGVLRTSAAFLFGPVGLIAAGATGLYLLSQRQTEAEKAADAHRKAMDLLSGSLQVGTVEAARQTAAIKQNAIENLNAAKAKLKAAEAQYALDAASAQSMAKYGATDRGDMAGIRAGASAAGVRNAQALADQARAALQEIDRALVEAGTSKAFDAIIPPAPELRLRTEAAEKAGKAVKKSADDAARAAAEAQRAEDARWASREDALRTLESWRAELAGPAAEAALRYARLEDELNAKLGESVITMAEYSDALGLVQQMRERDPALMSEQAKAAAEYEKGMRDYALSVRDAWVGAAADATRAFGDWFARGFRGAKDFARSLKDIFKRLVSDLVGMFLQRSLVDPFRAMLSQAMGLGGQMGSGFVAGGGNVLGGFFGAAMDKITGFFGRFFGRGGAATAGIESAVASGTGTAMDAAFALAKSQGVYAQAGMFGGIAPAGSAGAGAGWAGMSPWLGALGGAAMGFGMGGDLLGKLGGGLAGGVAGYGLLKAFGAYSAATAGGAGMGSALIAGVKAIPVAGWVAMGAMAVNALTGGKLFGTKFKAESGAQQIDIGASGASGYNSITEVRQRSFFRGRQWKTTQTALDAEAQGAINELFDTLNKTIRDAAGKLGVDVPALVGGSFRREFDAQGNLTKEFGTIAGKVYNEAQEAFASRLVGENLLAVAKMAGSAAELEQLADAYRKTGEELQGFATMALAVQDDLRKANGIWKQADGDGLMTRIVRYIDGIANAGESLADAYARIQQTVTAYGDLIGGVRTQLATRGLNQYQKAQLEVELAYRAQVQQANDLAKALGLTGARAEDLAAIEQLRALNMADLADQYRAQQQAQNRSFIEDLELSNLSPLRDDQKLARAMDLLRTAATAGDQNRAQKLAEQALGLGRDLYASGMDYNNLFAQVTGILSAIEPQTMEQLQGLTNEQLSSLADLVDGLPTRIAQEMAKVLVPTPPPASVDLPLPPAPVPAPPGSPPPGGGGGGGGGSIGDRPRDRIGELMPLMDVMDRVALSNERMLEIERQRDLDAMNAGTRRGMTL